MLSTTVYETESTLLISSFQVVEHMSVSSLKKFSLSQVMVKSDLRKSLKLVIHQGKLHVHYSRSYDSSPAQSWRLLPQFGGYLLAYIHPSMVGRVTQFLDKHFPHQSFSEINEWEDESIAEASFGTSGITDDEKLNIATLAVRMYDLCFPIYRKFNPNRLADGFYRVMPNDPFAEPYHRATEFKEFVTLLFGVYRKDLAKLVVDSPIEQIRWATNFVSLVDMDTIINAVKQSKPCTGVERKISFENIVDFPQPILKRLLKEGLTKALDDTLIDDALDMAEWVPQSQRKLCKTWDELHERGMVNYHSNADDSKRIVHTDEFEKFFSESDFGDLVVEPLRTAPDFIVTGKRMNVCVGSMSYITRAIDGEGYCFRLDTKDKKPHALIEVRKSGIGGGWNVNQVRGLSNATMPDELTQIISGQLSNYIKLESRN